MYSLPATGSVLATIVSIFTGRRVPVDTLFP
jgi:hypothetical protein